MGELAMRHVSNNFVLMVLIICLCVSCSVSDLSRKGLCVNNCFYSDTYSGPVNNLPEPAEKSP